MKLQSIYRITLLVGLAAATHAQESEGTAPGEASSAETSIETPLDPAAGEAGFTRASGSIQEDIQASVEALDQLRKEMAAEKIPMASELRSLEAELVRLRGEFQDITRTAEQGELTATSLKNKIAEREKESGYLSNLLSEYVRNFESRLHITEVQRYGEVIGAARVAIENADQDEEELFRAQSELLRVAQERAFEILGGTRFEGSAVDTGGMVRQGTFALMGPVALFRSNDGQVVGVADERLGSQQPTQIPFANPDDSAAAGALVSAGTGQFPLDPTLGNAHKVEATQEPWLEHVKKGGTVMIPIFTLAGAALLVALYKWAVLMLQAKPSERRLSAFLQLVGRGDQEGARAALTKIKGPIGTMLRAGVDHWEQPPELVEEVMYETVLTTRLKLQRMLPFIAICAASAPLLGLLGTVTGIIDTFKLITVFGSGDVKSLSGGISEALITTKFGLIVAIPSLLLHAFLLRKAKAITDQMEKAAVSFVNQSKKVLQPQAPRASVALPAGSVAVHQAPEAVDPDAVRRRVNEVLGELLVPLVEGDQAGAGSARGNVT